MRSYKELFENNQKWVKETLAQDKDFFRRQATRQTPEFLFIGCSDSRVPPNLVTGTDAGELFVHRNIANQVIPSDINTLAVLQYAVEVLDVRHVIVCGHYNCGGVKAALTDTARYGLVDYWLAGIRQLRRAHEHDLDKVEDDQKRLDRLVEMSVRQQLHNLAETPTIRQAWERGKRPILHGVVYSLEDGLMHELVSGIDSAEAAEKLFPTR